MLGWDGAHLEVAGQPVGDDPLARRGVLDEGDRRTQVGQVPRPAAVVEVDHGNAGRDVGRIDQRGYVTIVGRSKDLIISGGYNVYPAEVEGYINDMPGVAESALVGVPHPDFGEAVVAVIVRLDNEAGAALTEAGVISELKGVLANFKVPKRVHFIDELPRNSMGKVQKKVLRDQDA